jgi:hypothetical protein
VPALVADLVRRGVAVIATPGSTPDAIAAKADRFRRRGAAALDRTHDLQLVEADVTDVDRTPRRSVGALTLRTMPITTAVVSNRPCGRSLRIEPHGRRAS